MVETFSSYEKLRIKDPAEAERLSNDIQSKWETNLQLIYLTWHWSPNLRLNEFILICKTAEIPLWVLSQSRNSQTLLDEA